MPKARTRHTVTATLEALRLQTQQRGGCPSVNDITDATLNVANAIDAYRAVRAAMAALGTPETKAMRELDRAMSQL